MYFAIFFFCELAGILICKTTIRVVSTIKYVSYSYSVQ